MAFDGPALLTYQPVVPTGFDPYWDNVVLLVRAQGPQGGNQFLDISKYGTPINPVLGLSDNDTGLIDFASTATGSGALKQFAANQGLLLRCQNNLYAFGTGDFTIECWAKTSSAAAIQGLFSASPDPSPTGWSMLLTPTTLEFDYAYAAVISAPATTNDGVWHHWAVSRTGTTVRAFKDGIQIGTATYGASINLARIRYAAVGQLATNGSYPFAGSIEELRITKGVARYTGNFTPLTVPFYSVLPTDTGDPYFNWVSLLMHFNDPANGLPPTDSSQPSFSAALTNGVVSTTQKKFGTSSFYNAGVSSGGGLYLRAEFWTQLCFTLPTDFTIEFWAYGTGSTANGAVFTTSTAPDTSDGYSVELSDVGLVLNYLGAARFTAATGGYADSVWHHWAITRESGVIYGFKDGVLLGSGAYAVSLPSGSYVAVYICGYYNIASSYQFKGYIDDLRVTNGIARYTATFSPPTAPFPDRQAYTTDPYATSTVMYVPMNATPLVDQVTPTRVFSGSGNSLVTGAPILSKATKFSSSSITATTEGLYLASGDFTIEFWTLYASMLDFVTAGATYNAWDALGGQSNAYMRASLTNAGWDYMADTGQSGEYGWYHYAFVRKNGVLYAYMNGHVNTSLASAIGANSVSFPVGLLNIGWGEGATANGCMSSLRITRAARYLSDFIPPTVPVTYSYTGTGDPYWTRVAYLLHGEGTDGGTTVTDSSWYARSTTVTGVTTSATQKKWGATSLFFNNTQSLVTSSSDVIFYPVGDFTIEAWVYVTAFTNAVAGIVELIDTTTGAGASNYVKLYCTSAGNLTTYIRSNAVDVSNLAGSSTLVVNTWYHVAINRSGNVHTTYLNGVAETTFTTSYTMSGSSSTWKVYTGYSYATAASYHVGYIDDVRITMGAGRYPTGFAVPAVAFPNDNGMAGTYGSLPSPYVPPGPSSPPTGCILLLHGDGLQGSTSIVDSSPSNRAVTAVTAVTLNVTNPKFGVSSIQLTDPRTSLFAFPPSPDFEIGGLTASATVEMWIKPTVNALSNLVNWGTSWGVTLFANGTIGLWMSSASGAWTFSVSTISVTPGVWVHVACVLTSGSMRVYVNGVGNTPVTLPSYFNIPPTPYLTFGGGGSVGGAGPIYVYTGYIDEVRILNGTAAYTGNFTPFTAPFGGASPAVPSGTLLLIHCDGSPSSTVFTDSSSYAQAVTNFGNGVRVDPNGAEFPGVNNSGLILPYASGGRATPWNLFSESVSGTVEFFFQPIAGVDFNWPYGLLFAFGQYYWAWWNPPGVVHIHISTTVGILRYQASQFTPATGQCHLAFVNNAGRLNIYVNGVGSPHGSSPINSLGPTIPITEAPEFSIGSTSLGPFGYLYYALTGYINEFKVSSTAVYTSNFTPPTRPLSP